MSTNSSLDRESFQRLLASAFAVQESRMDTQSLSAVIQVQRLVAAGDLGTDEAMHVIAEHTLDVANAAGVAIGLLEGHQLVYRVGIGSAESFVGRHVAATFGVSGDGRMSREILRVENAQSDARIEAAICRQLGAESLLIMPIYQGSAVIGVIEVLFSEAHSFQDCEVRCYRMMAGLLGEALSRAAQLKEQEKSSPAAPPLAVPAILGPPFLHLDIADDNPVAEPGNRHVPDQIDEVALAAVGNIPTFSPLPGVNTSIRERAKRLPLRVPHISLGVPQWIATVATLLAIVIISWATYVHHDSLKVGRPAARITNPDPRLVPSPDATPPIETSAPNVAPAQGKQVPKAAFRRVRVAENEIDYVADDVTMRYFVPPPQSRRQVSAGYNQVEFGRDVTVRYFASNAQTTPGAGATVSGTQPVNRTLPVAEKSDSRKLVR